MAKAKTKKSSKAHTSAALGVTHTVYHKDGSIYAKGRMLNGTMHDSWKFYRKDGSIMRSGSFDRGEQTGTWTTFASSGLVVKVTHMKSGPRASAHATKE